MKYIDSWSLPLYGMQWNYPNILDVAYEPDAMTAYAPIPTEITSTAPAALPPQQIAPSIPIPAPAMVTSSFKPFIIPALLVATGVVLYMVLRK